MKNNAKIHIDLVREIYS